MSELPILLVEDDPSIGQLLKEQFSEQGLAVEWHADGAQAWHRFECQPFALVLLDVMVPLIDGFELCRRIRRTDRAVPIIMITARTSLQDVVRGLELGADDYICKPFRMREVLARVQVALRRVAPGRDPGIATSEDEVQLRSGSLSLDIARREAILGARKIALTAKEGALLAFFMRHPGQVFRREELLEAVWGPTFDGYDHTVNTHLNRLRGKLDSSPGQARMIVTVWGAGYRFDPPT